MDKPKYIVTSGTALIELMDSVNYYLAQGYELQGGVSAVTYRNTSGIYRNFYQALIKPATISNRTKK